jgi:hypothetical protein
MATNINIGKGLNPQIRLIGEWDLTNQFLTNLPLVIKEAEINARRSIAERVVKTVKKNIRNGGPQGTNWPDYSDKYSKWKSRKGYNVNRKWRLTNTLYNNIRVLEYNKQVVAGLPRNKYGKRYNGKQSKITLIEISNILERGDSARGIRARPLWKPSFREFGGLVKVEYLMKFYLRRELRLAYNLKRTTNLFRIDFKN